MRNEHPKRAASRPASLVGTVLSRKWHIDRLLGSGGTSSVYSATHRNGKRVAIKVLAPELSASVRFRTRFLREGYIANRVGHAGAVSVLDDEEDGGSVFLVMELLEGRTLEDLCSRRGGRLPAHEVVAIALELLAVLDAAHANGIVHRDVKPGNVFVTTKNEIKLLDFGIASMREVPGVSMQTETGVMLGTPGFMAPEQARGRWAELTPGTDIWAVGATMFKLLSGHLVHEEETSSEIVIAAATRPARSLASLCPELPESLVDAVDRALALEPSARFATASAMREALQSASVGLPSLALPELVEALGVRNSGNTTHGESPSSLDPEHGTIGSLIVTGNSSRTRTGELSRLTDGWAGRIALGVALTLVLGGAVYLTRERRPSERGAGSAQPTSTTPPMEAGVAVSKEATETSPSPAPARSSAPSSVPTSSSPRPLGSARPPSAPVTWRRPPTQPSASAEARPDDLLRERL